MSKQKDKQLGSQSRRHFIKQTGAVVLAGGVMHKLGEGDLSAD